MIRYRLLMLSAVLVAATGRADEGGIALAVHGGAGAIPRAAMTPEKERAVRADLERALREGHAVLVAGGSALDAVTRAVVVLEDSPHFNAGKGAVFTADGRHELDAAIMEGHTRRAGAVAGIRRVKNPIRAARAVMESSPHVMLVGEGADAFAKQQGLERVRPSYFHTEERWRQLQEARARARPAPRAALPAQAYFGTVGAVARDASGHLAAATSTGGMTNKRWGRVGDAPIIGAGTWADAGCAVSATGWGEFFIRAAVAHDICARVAYRGDTLAAAAEEVVMRVVPGLGGDGGVIAIAADGRIAMPFATEGMYRGSIDAEGRVTVAIYRD